MLITNFQQYQTQLELERMLILNKLQTFASQGKTIDPVRQNIFHQMEVTLNRVERAQDRLETGQFGQCQGCGQPIDLERLEILPYAEHCTACQRRLERQTLRGSRQQV